MKILLIKVIITTYLKNKLYSLKILRDFVFLCFLIQQKTHFCWPKLRERERKNRKIFVIVTNTHFHSVAEQNFVSVVSQMEKFVVVFFLSRCCLNSTTNHCCLLDNFCYFAIFTVFFSHNFCFCTRAANKCCYMSSHLYFGKLKQGQGHFN